MSKQNHQKRLSTFRLWTIAVVIVLALWFGSWIYFGSQYSGLRDWNERGSFGDMFGAVNALFAGLAFAALIITIYLQSKALRDTQQEVEQRTFENKFFQLLRGHNDILNAISKYQMMQGQLALITGRQRFDELYRELTNDFNRLWKDHPQEDQFALVQQAWSSFFARNQADIGHYFRNLYNIVAFIDRSTIPNKEDFTKLLRAQLSSNEMLLLFYNCLGDIGIRKFKRLIEDYHLMEHLPERRLISDILQLPVDHRSLYKASAFAD